MGILKVGSALWPGGLKGRGSHPLSPASWSRCPASRGCAHWCSRSGARWCSNAQSSPAAPTPSPQHLHSAELRRKTQKRNARFHCHPLRCAVPSSRGTPPCARGGTERVLSQDALGHPTAAPASPGAPQPNVSPPSPTRGPSGPERYAWPDLRSHPAPRDHVAPRP